LGNRCIRKKTKKEKWSLYKKEKEIMQIEHYNAIAKIVGGVLDNNERLNAMVKTLTSYFESVDENFDSGEFRSACLNGHLMEETPEINTTPTETEIVPTTVPNRADN
jgi:hypothetical protein